ncbi:DMT family transporter [Uliginosibacterium paludis]|uniref:DMT family transporter n=1 Tax=Uliginosibacterium paludis TaxID=1615952 RepID=A0ABV2CTN3_9RHOO
MRTPSPDSSRPLLAASAVLLALAAQNIGAAFAKQLFPLVGAEGVTALRVGISAAILLALWRPWRRLPSRQDARNLLIYGLGMGCMNLFIYHAFARIPIGIAVAIEVSGPLSVVLFASRRPRDFAWLACMVMGLTLLLPITRHASALDPVGVLWAIGAAVCWALYIVFGKRVSHIESGHAVAWGMTAAALFAVPLGVSHAGSALLSPVILLTGLTVAVLSSTLPYSFEMMALRRLPRRVFGILVSAAPAIAALAGWLILDERLGLQQWLAIALVMFASAGSAATTDRSAAAA